MPASKPPLSLGFNVEFSEALRAAERVTVPASQYYSASFQGIFRQKAFSIAGIASLDQLQAVNDSLAKFMKDGGSFNAWKKQSAVINLNLPPHRIENIWRTNLQGNYMRGRAEQIYRNAATRPYLLFDAINDSRVRPSHLAHDGVIRPVSDPFWKTHFPPLGYQCRCSVISLTESQARARSGFNSNNEGLGLNKVPTNEDGSIANPDPGWDYNPYEDALKTWKPDPVRYHPKLREVLAEIEEKAAGMAVEPVVEPVQPAAYWDKTTPHGQWHESSFNGSPEWMKEAIRRHDPDFNGMLYVNKKDNAYYGPYEQKIDMGSHNKERAHGQGVWRHEYGHYIDHRLKINESGLTYKFRSADKDFTNLMRKETKELVKISNAETINVEGWQSQKLKDEAKAALDSRNLIIEKVHDDFMALDTQQRIDYLSGKAQKLGMTIDDVGEFFDTQTVHKTYGIERQSRMNILLDAIDRRDASQFMEALDGRLDRVKKTQNYNQGLIGKFSDLIGSASKNKLLGHGWMGNGGHSDSYLKKTGNSQTEVFANLTALLGSDSVFWRTVVPKFYPGLSKLFIEIMKNG